MQALPDSAVAPTPEAPVFGADDENGEQKYETGSKTGISSLKIKKDPVNVAGANLQLPRISGVKVT